MNKGMVVKYYHSNGIMQLIYKDNVIEFSINEIKRIIEYKSYELAEGRTQWLLWSDYHYTIIELVNGDIVFLNSLLVPNLTLPVDDSKIEVRKRFFTFPWSYFFPLVP